MVKRRKPLNFYKVMAIPSLVNISEAWTLGTQDLNRIQATQMKYL